MFVLDKNQAKKLIFAIYNIYLILMQTPTNNSPKLSNTKQKKTKKILNNIHFCDIKKTEDIFNIFCDASCEIDTILDNIIIITQENIYCLYSDLLHNYKNKIIFISSKDVTELPPVLNKLISLSANKNTVLVGFGGGEVTDVAAFIASVYMRGIKCKLIPTTLLAMVDAAIGGKSAMNIGAVKNSIGSIRQVDDIYINTNFIKTLPYIEKQNGLVEIVKIAILRDASLLDLIINNQDKIFDEEYLLLNIIKKAIDIKLKIVNEDMYDFGIRNILNFGHTIGHLLELKYNISHGQAVAIGMFYETNIAKNLGFITSETCDKICDILKIFNLDFYKYPIYDLIQNIYFDKKIKHDKINFTYVSEIGRANLINLKIDDILSHIEKV